MWYSSSNLSELTLLVTCSRMPGVQCGILLTCSSKLTRCRPVFRGSAAKNSRWSKTDQAKCIQWGLLSPQQRLTWPDRQESRLGQWMPRQPVPLDALPEQSHSKTLKHFGQPQHSSNLWSNQKSGHWIDLIRLGEAHECYFPGMNTVLRLSESSDFARSASCDQLSALSLFFQSCSITIKFKGCCYEK